MATIENITSNPKPDSYVIDANLVNASDRTKGKLINNSDETFTCELGPREITFKLVGPLYINSVEIMAEENIKKVKLRVENIINNRTITIDGEEGETQNTKIFNVGKFAKSIKLQGSYLSKIKLGKLTINGFRIQDLSDIEDKFTSLEQHIESTNLSVQNSNEDIINRESVLTAERNKFNEYKASLSEEINQSEEAKTVLIEEVEQLNKDKEDIEEKLIKINGEVVSLGDQINENYNKLSSVENNIDIKKSELKILNSGILQREAKKKELDSDISLFTDEIKSYVDECRSNINSYSLLCFIPWVLILVVTYKLFDGAAELVIGLNEMNDINVWDVLIGRIPFVFISSLIIITSFMVSEVFFKRIMEIHRDRLKLSKLSIIAKDVSDTEAQGLDLDDQDIYQGRIALKMQLLRSHLSHEIDSDFEFNILDKTGVAKRIAAAYGVKVGDFKKNKEKDRDEEVSG